MEQESSKRLFIALLPGNEALDALQQTQEALVPDVEKARFSPRSNLHLTLAFLGMQDAAGEAAAWRALVQTAESAFQESPATVTLDVVGTFGKYKGGSVLWRGLAEDAGMHYVVDLRACLRKALLEQGFDIDRSFTPHITLARGVRPVQQPQETAAHALERICAACTKNAPTAMFAAAHISLMWSHRPEPDHLLTYTEIGRAPLSSDTGDGASA